MHPFKRNWSVEEWLFEEWLIEEWLSRRELSAIFVELARLTLYT